MVSHTSSRLLRLFLPMQTQILAYLDLEVAELAAVGLLWVYINRLHTVMSLVDNDQVASFDGVSGASTLVASGP